LKGQEGGSDKKAIQELQLPQSGMLARRIQKNRLAHLIPHTSGRCKQGSSQISFRQERIPDFMHFIFKEQALPYHLD